MHSIQGLLKYLFYQYLSIPLKIMSGFFLQCFEIYIDESCHRSIIHIPSNQLNSFSLSEDPLCRVDWLKSKLNFIQHSLLIVFHTSNKLKLARKYIHIVTDKHYSNCSFINLNQNNAYHFHTREMQVKDSVYLWAETGEYVMTNTPKLWTGFKKCLPFARKKSWSVTIVTSQNVSHVFDPWDFFIFVVPYHYWNVNTDTCECVTICTTKNEKPFICI